MRHLRLISALLGPTVIFGVAGCASHGPSTITACGMIPPTPDRLVGVWSGFDSGDLVFYRLDLRRDFTGYLASVSPEGSSLHEYGVDVYEITRWSLKDFSLSIQLHPATTNAEDIYAVGEYGGVPLELEVGGTNGEWKRKVTLHWQSDWEASTRETKAAISQVEGR
jgi:hypothetical protein